MNATKNTPDHALTDLPSYSVATHGLPEPDGRLPATARVTVALDESAQLLRDVLGWRPDTDTEQAARCHALALIAARRAGWWSVLRRAAVADLATPMVYALAARAARDEQRDRARFWRDLAADWTARAEHRPTSDAAGALSNWHELGVSA